MANLNPSAWYVNYGNGTSTEYYAVAKWTALTSYPVGSLVRQLTTPAVGSERVFVQVTPTTHTSGASEPTWVTTRYGAVTDATCTWIECTGDPAVNGDATNALTWAQQHALSTTVTAGLIIYDSVSGALQIVTTGGTIGASAPSFSATAGTTTTDNTATWTSLGAISGFKGSSKWSAPHARLNTVLSTSGYAAPGNQIFVGDDHAESQSTGITIAANGSSNSLLMYVYCVDHTVAVPPGSSNTKTTATVTSTGGAINIGGTLYFYGISFIFNAFSIFGVGSAADWQQFDYCAFTLPSSGTLQFYQSGYGQQIILNGCTFNYSSGAVMLFSVAGVHTLLKSCTLTGVTGSTGIIRNDSGGVVTFQDCDLSALGNSVLFASNNSASTLDYTFLNCRLGSGYSIGTPAYHSQNINVIVSDSSGTTYQQQRYTYEGTLTPSTAIVRAGGASDGVTPISWNLTTTANSSWYDPFLSIPRSIWNTTLGTNRGVTLYGVWNSASLPNNDQIWIEVESLGASGSPLGNVQTQTKANGLAAGAALAADSTSTWGASVTPRPNSTSVNLGAAYYVNVGGGGGLFFVTTAGTTASSQPGGYATATDGQTVTDGTAVLRAATRFILTVTLSSPQPALAGMIRTTVKAALPSATFFIDPLINLS